MRILCDQNVDEKYVHALEQAEGLTVTTVRELLDPEASDEAIARTAEADGWVVLTNDDDFFVQRPRPGLLFYDQIEDPRPGDIVAAIQQIATFYDEPAAVVETVPGDWIQ